jgi:hypothetical protein
MKNHEFPISLSIPEDGTLSEGAAWRKSSYSYQEANCVEVATLPEGLIGIRDSKAPEFGHLALPPAVFTEFTAAIQAGNYDTL